MSIKGLAWYTSSGTYSISPFTFKLMILNLTLLLWSTGFSLFSGGSTNLKTVNPSKKIRRGTQQNIKWSRRGGWGGVGRGVCCKRREDQEDWITSSNYTFTRSKYTTRRTHITTLWCSCLELKQPTGYMLDGSDGSK